MSESETFFRDMTSLLPANGKVDSAYTVNAAERIVGKLNHMSIEQAEQVGTALKKSLKAATRQIDSSGDNKFSEEEILAAAKNNPEALLNVLPGGIGQKVDTAVQAGLKEDGNPLIDACKSPQALDKQLRSVESNYNATASKLKSARVVSIIYTPSEEIGDAANTALKNSLGADAPQLSEKGSRNLSEIILEASKGIPREIKLPSAGETCSVVAPSVQNAYMASNSSPQR